MKPIILLSLLILTACTTAPVVVEPVVNEYGVPECSVNGEINPFTDNENRSIIQTIVNEYCPLE